MRPMLLTTENNVIRVLAARRYASARALVAMALCLSVTSDVGTMGTEEVHCTPKFRTCTPYTLQVKDAAYVKILSERL